MSFPTFSKIDKAPKDLLKKDFYDAKKAPFTLEQKMAAPFGTKLTTTINYLTNGALNAVMSTEYSTGQGFNVDKFEIAGNNKFVTETSIEGGPLPDGLKVEFAGDNKDKGEATATFKNDTVTADATLDLVNMSKASLSVCSGASGMTFGASTDVNIAGSKLDDYSIGGAYTVPKTCFASLILTKQLSQADVTMGYTVNSDVSLAAAMSYKGKVSDFKVGASYQCNPCTVVKVKANTNGCIDTSVKQKLAPKTVATLKCSFNVSKPEPSFGGAITLG